MIIKKRKPPAEIGEWRRVFKVLPVRTEDGHISFLGHVYKKMTGDVMRPVVYHTDPHGEEMKKLVDDIDTHVNNFLEMQLEETREEIEAVRPKRPPPPPAPPNVRIGGYRYKGKPKVKA